MRRQTHSFCKTFIDSFEIIFSRYFQASKKPKPSSFQNILHIFFSVYKIQPRIKFSVPAVRMFKISREGPGQRHLRMFILWCQNPLTPEIMLIQTKLFISVWYFRKIFTIQVRCFHYTYPRSE